jgi:CDP-diacylglycerol--glycerol-3-phosphate 3-phosphatidyltransferase
VTERQLQITREPGLWPPTWPMGMTWLRLFLLPVFLYVLLSDAGPGGAGHRHRWLAVGIFAVMAITDKLDGYLARKLNQTSKLGMMLDPVADKLLIVSCVILLSLDWVAPVGYQIPWYVVVPVYGKDIVVAVGSLVLLSLVGHVTITPRPLGKLGTFLQLSMIIATLVAPDVARLSDRGAWWWTRVLWVAVAVVSAASCIDYFVQGCRQFAAARKKGVGASDGAQMNTGDLKSEI